MKAVVFRRYGSPELLELREVATPAPASDEVLVRVHAASVNSWDWELLRGRPLLNRLLFGLRRPRRIRSLGCDVAGRVEAVGTGVGGLRPGDEVFGDLSACGWGGFAEYVCARENAWTLKPAGMTFEQAAATPQAAVLALQGLCEGKRIGPGHEVLINGAGGGVGTFAVQMAKAFGATVTGVDRPQKLDLLRSLGADRVVDCTRQDFTARAPRYDLILDVVGNRSLHEYGRCLAPGGTYFMVGGPTSLILRLVLLGPWVGRATNKRLRILVHRPNRDLERIGELFEAGRVTPVIDRVYPLPEVARALRHLGEGRVRGKVVVTVHAGAGS